MIMLPATTDGIDTLNSRGITDNNKNTLNGIVIINVAVVIAVIYFIPE